MFFILDFFHQLCITVIKDGAAVTVWDKLGPLANFLGSCNLVIVPWPGETLEASSLLFAVTLATQESRNVFVVDELENGRPIIRTDDLDLASCLFVEEAFDNGPDSVEQHRCVDAKEIAHDLRVVVTANL